MQILIADDEPGALSRLASVLESQVGPALVLYRAGGGMEALKVIEDKEPDFAFLDIHMPDLTGIEVAFSVQGTKTKIIFVTAYDDHAVKAFEAGAIDYVLKPYRESRIGEALKKGQRDPEYLSMVKGKLPAEKYSLKVAGAYRILAYRNTSALLAQGDYLEIYCGEEKLLAEKTLSGMLQQLPDYFVRIHRSSVINLNYLTEVRKQETKGFYVLLNDHWAHELPVSSSYQKSLLSLLT